jgi:hypothetical protein
MAPVPPQGQAHVDCHKQREYPPVAQRLHVTLHPAAASKLESRTIFGPSIASPAASAFPLRSATTRIRRADTRLLLGTRPWTALPAATACSTHQSTHAAAACWLWLYMPDELLPFRAAGPAEAGLLHTGADTPKLWRTPPPPEQLCRIDCTWHDPCTRMNHSARLQWCRRTMVLLGEHCDGNCILSGRALWGPNWFGPALLASLALKSCSGSP